MKRFLIAAGIITLVALTTLSFLPGFGPDQLGYEDESLNTIGPLSYFKTPQSAVLTTSRLLTKGDWKKLSQFYDQQDSVVDYGTLLDGSYFRIESEDRSMIRPFAPECRHLKTLATEFEDVYEVVVQEAAANGAPCLPGAFYLKRYPEGYRILPNRPSQPGSGAPQ